MIGAIILGIVAGFLGRFLMPGKDPLGASSPPSCSGSPAHSSAT
jgi:hypothetical protein